MSNTIVRIDSIEIKNFKNIGYGYIDFANSEDDSRASVLGLYGQNGSGKTALIDALELLRLALSGKPVPEYFADYINVNSLNASFEYSFNIFNNEKGFIYRAKYKFNFYKVIETIENNTNHLQEKEEEHYKAVISDEVLSYSFEHENTKVRFSPIIDTRTKEDVVFTPISKYLSIIGKDKRTLTNLVIAKAYTRTTSRSFIFSKEFLDVIRKNSNEQNNYHSILMESLVFFGNFQLFVINTTNSGLISLNALPLAVNFTENNSSIIGNLLINLNESSMIPETSLEVVHKLIERMNIVLIQLIPGLMIKVKDIEPRLYPNGTAGYLIQLMSNKNSKEIPLRYESEGIKKIISVLQLLIVVYNEPSMTVAIDELDSGIFEYLLGELLYILSEQGKGQLVFTSHNLRPLETIDKRFIAFTTTNPQNRFIRMNNVKTIKNLRDFYYRDIILGEQKESVYEPTNNSEIALAFMESGNSNVS